ncbi:MAG: hypothetical protein RIQ89_225 [Bacteroidota bacterium]|jgi:penicillin-binding protein 2
MNISSGRHTVIAFIILIVSIIYLLRIFYLQVIDDSYKLSANNNVLRYVTEYPARGLIYDRHGSLLVYNEPVYDLMITPKQVVPFDTASFCRIIGISEESFIEKFKKAKAYSPVKSSLFEKQLSIETYATLQEKLYQYPGFYVQTRTLRKYPEPIAAHLFGYIGEVDTSITNKDYYYKEGDYIGKSGIELSYEKELRGRRGLRVVMVDVFNREKGSFKNGAYDTIAIAGQNLTLSLDARIQRLGEELLQGKVGSIVAIEPSTGEILAMVSSPSYDPNLLVGRARSKNYATLLKDPYKPLFNRALMAMYPPGSTFKLVMSLVGQQEGVLTPEVRYPCHGGYPPGGGKPKCHSHASGMDLRGAIATSCNSYFSYVFKTVIDNKNYKTIYQSFDRWRTSIANFGIGIKLDADLPHILRGSVPTIPYYDKVFGKQAWKSSTIISLGIGQGELGITPLQNANIIAGIANQGYYMPPHIVKKVGANNAKLPAKLKQKHFMGVAQHYYPAVIDGMQEVMEHGTGASVKIKDITMCGKTGTAQNPHGKDHSMFVAFAPRQNPQIAIAVSVENAGFGATYAAPIASLLIEKYLTDTILRPELFTRIAQSSILPKIEAPKNLSQPDSIKGKPSQTTR